MAELRYNPFKKSWTMIASLRQNRPQMPESWCPFCPGSGQVPDDFIVYKYDNDFPALSSSPPVPDNVHNDFFITAPSYGKCEVILYSKEHTVTLPELSNSHMRALIDLWVERNTEIKKDSSIKYIFIFENRGEKVGVTMPHPHGQIYGYPFIPDKIKSELENSKEYFSLNNKNLFDVWLQNEQEFGKRIIFENEHFCVLLPFFSETVYGMQIVSKQNIVHIDQFDDKQRNSLGICIRDTVGTLDSLFDIQMPYMMAMHQAPVNTKDDYSSFYRFHIEFIPVLRSKDKQQFFASSESGAGAFCNPTAPEDIAQDLKLAYEKFLSKLKARGE